MAQTDDERRLRAARRLRNEHSDPVRGTRRGNRDRATDRRDSGSWAWLWIVLLLVVAGLFVWWLLARDDSTSSELPEEPVPSTSEPAATP